MRKLRRSLWLLAGGLAVLGAAAVLVLKGIEITLLLERQAALVFEDSAAREARARVPEMESELRARESAALSALAALPAEPTRSDLAGVAARHPLIHTPFLLAPDQTLFYPPPAPPALAALAEEEPAPEVYLEARRLASDRSGFGAAALTAFRAVSSAPELPAPWRLRARAAIAAYQLRTGRAGEAAAGYAAIETDFREELAEIERPSRGQLRAARALALDAAGRREEAVGLLLRTLHEIEAAGPLAPGGDDFALLLAKARALSAGAADPGLGPEIERLSALAAEGARSLGFARQVRGWVIPRLERGGEPDRFAEEQGGERALVAWSQAREGSGRSALGFLQRPSAILAVFQESLGRASAAEREARLELPLRVEPAPPPAGFHELASLSGELQGFRLGLAEADWGRLLGSARRPFRIAAALIAALGLFLAASAGLAFLAIRREVFLAKMKTEFVANVSHELKTPLALIRLFGETLLLERVRDPVKAREYHQVIVRESERLTHLVNNVLDFAGLESGKRRFSLCPTGLGPLVEETLAAYRLQLEERGFKLELSIEPELPEVMVDPEAAAQALRNLLDNAIKYSPARKEVEVSVSKSEGAVRVAVSDRGMGIAPGEERRVFETFYRSPAARRLGTRGSGLGLALVRHILKAHGGSVELKSKLGLGSTFTLVFPLISEEAAPVPPGPECDSGAPEAGRGVKA
jgi:signal transduction histidine kinase